jgi:tetratricopeptide (TPR) repeat protein
MHPDGRQLDQDIIMKPLDTPDSHYLSAAIGWLGLGMRAEATQELRKITPHNAAHPDVLEVLWHIHAKTGQWTDCLNIAEVIIELDPERAFGWIHRAFALYELRRTQEAYDRLLPVAKRFPTLWKIPYALACYCAQLGRFIEAQLWLRKAMAINREIVRRIAVTDPNLQPLWVSMRSKNAPPELLGDMGSTARVPAAGKSVLLSVSSKRMP